MEIRKAYHRTRVTFATTGESKTHQSMAPECDINRIMLKWQKTGVLEHANRFEGQYGDYTDVPADYHEAMNQIVATNEMFLSLPAQLRKRFHNDPGEFLEFVEDENNRDEMKKLGLLRPEQPDLVLEDPEPKKAAPAAKKPAPDAAGDE